VATVRSRDGTTLAFDRTGAGPAVILVGGAIQYRAFDPSSARLAELLAERFTALRYDRRGRGDSGDTPPDATEREVEDVAALIGAAGGAAMVFGMSSGCALVLDAAQRGLGISRVALYELLGSGKADAGFDGSGMSVARLAILPGLTHYTIFSSPALASTVTPFLDAPTRTAA
jgi:pimeloyl-ACP methyl ester carboxylesterase